MDIIWIGGESVRRDETDRGGGGSDCLLSLVNFLSMLRPGLGRELTKLPNYKGDIRSPKIGPQALDEIGE